MGRAGKDLPLPEADTCGRYCFPEISGVAEADPLWRPADDHFVDGATNADADGTGSPTDPPAGDRAAERIQMAYQDGLAQGRAEALASVQEPVSQATAALTLAADELLRVRTQDLARMEVETVRLALAIAKKIVGVEAAQGEAICHVVRAAMEKVGDPRGLTLKLNPRDVEAIRRCEPAAFLDDAGDTPFRIEPDEGIARGGCMIETQLGDVDARIDQQINIMEALLIDALNDRGRDGSER